MKRLADAFRKAGRPVVYVAHVLKSDYSDGAISVLEGDAREPQSQSHVHYRGHLGRADHRRIETHEGEHLVVKKGFGGFSNTPLDTILRNMDVNTCVVTGVTTCVCVSTTIRGGVEHNYNMMIVKDAVAECTGTRTRMNSRPLQRVFAAVKSTDEVIAMLENAA